MFETLSTGSARTCWRSGCGLFRGRLLSACNLGVHASVCKSHPWRPPSPIEVSSCSNVLSPHSKLICFSAAWRRKSNHQQLTLLEMLSQLMYHSGVVWQSLAKKFLTTSMPSLLSRMWKTLTLLKMKRNWCSTGHSVRWSWYQMEERTTKL